MAIQTQGAGGAIAEVDATRKALRTAISPVEVLNWEGLSVRSGALTGVAAAAPVFQFKNTGSTNPIIVRRVGVGFVTTTAFTTPQTVDFQLVVFRVSTVTGSGGTQAAFTGNNAKHRTILPTVTGVDARIATTGTLTTGTRTLDANAIGMQAGFSAAAGVTIALADSNLFSHVPGDYPLILAASEGFEIQVGTAMGAAGVGSLYVTLEFAETTTY